MTEKELWVLVRASSYFGICYPFVDSLSIELFIQAYNKYILYLATEDAKVNKISRFCPPGTNFLVEKIAS